MSLLRLRLPILLALFAALTLAACESDLEFSGDPAAALTLQARSAVDVLPPDPGFVAMVDLKAVQENDLTNPFGSDGFAGKMGAENAARLQDFLDATGLDPAEDFTAAYIAADPAAEDHAPALVLYANLDRARIEAYVEERMEGTLDHSPYRGTTIYLDREKKAAFSVANENMIVASASEVGVQAMLDRLAGDGRSLSDDAATMALVGRAAGGAGGWFVARRLDAPAVHTTRDPGEDHPMENLRTALRDVSLSFDIQRDRLDGTVLLYPRAGVSVDDVASLTRGILAAMKADPGLTEAQLELLDEVEIRTADDCVRVVFEADNAALKAMGAS